MLKQHQKTRRWKLLFQKYILVKEKKTELIIKLITKETGNRF
jgi:hypothetical protein